MRVTIVLLLFALLGSIAPTEVVKHSSKSVEQGKGSDGKGGHVAEQKQEVSGGKSSKHHVESAAKGQDLKELHKGEHLEKKGKKSSHHDEDSYKSSKSAGGGSHHGLKYADGKKYKKGNYLKGYREKFHRDEEKKHDSFFSNGEKSGEYQIYGKKKNKYNSESYSKKNKKNHKNSSSAKSGGKASKSARGHQDADHKSHQKKGGFEKHRKSSSKHGKKQASQGGSSFKTVV